MAWHIAPDSQRNKILRGGIAPQTTLAGQVIKWPEPETILFTKLKDVYDFVGHMEAIIDPEQKYALFHVATRLREGQFTRVRDHIPEDNISLITRDVTTFIPFDAHHALDRVADPYADVEAFKATQVQMSARDFGKIVNDLAWADEGLDAQFLVFGAGYYIEILKDDRHLLTIENQGWITSPETNLDDMISVLFDYARDQHRPQEIEAEAPGF